jgi:hypothetical protein
VLPPTARLPVIYALSCTVIALLKVVSPVTVSVPIVALSAATLSAFTVPSTYTCRHSFVGEPRSNALSSYGTTSVLIDELKRQY